jgi:hypothetical protein
MAKASVIERGYVHRDVFAGVLARIMPQRVARKKVRKESGATGRLP